VGITREICIEKGLKNNLMWILTLNNILKISYQKPALTLIVESGFLDASVMIRFNKL